jgi:hypothetical protein
MTSYDDPRVSDQQLLARISDLRMRDSLSRTTSEAKARMEKAGCSPADWAPLTAGEHLELLRTQRWLEQRLSRRGCGVHRALQAGADWPDIAAALGLDVDEVQAEFREWIAGQRQLHQQIGIGLSLVQAEVAAMFLGDTVAA